MIHHFQCHGCSSKYYPRPCVAACASSTAQQFLPVVQLWYTTWGCTHVGEKKHRLSLPTTVIWSWKPNESLLFRAVRIPASHLFFALSPRCNITSTLSTSTISMFNASAIHVMMSRYPVVGDRYVPSTSSLSINLPRRVAKNGGIDPVFFNNEMLGNGHLCHQKITSVNDQLHLYSRTIPHIAKSTSNFTCTRDGNETYSPSVF